MNNINNINIRLADVNDSVLVVIDVQDGFLNKYDRSVAQHMLAKSAWIIEVAQYLGVPVIAMGEDLEQVGPLHPTIMRALRKGSNVYSKEYFGLAGNPEILKAVNATDRKTAVLIGMETDVCVAQSALGLIENNFQVVILQDAVITTAADQEVGLERMRRAGAVISSVKAIYYEWQRSVSNCKKLRAEAVELQTSKRPDCLIL